MLRDGQLPDICHNIFIGMMAFLRYLQYSTRLAIICFFDLSLDCSVHCGVSASMVLKSTGFFNCLNWTLFNIQEVKSKNNLIIYYHILHLMVYLLQQTAHLLDWHQTNKPFIWVWSCLDKQVENIKKSHRRNSKSHLIVICYREIAVCPQY